MADDLDIHRTISSLVDEEKDLRARLGGGDPGDAQVRPGSVVEGCLE